MPITQCWNFVIGEFTNWLGWMASWQLFGVSFVWYAIALSLLGMMLDYIFG